MRRFFKVLAVTLALAGPAWAVNPGEVLSDPGLEARARTISATIRCVVCQNQSIDESNADIAADMRVILRERLVAGDSDAAAVAYLVERYGTFILLNPPVMRTTLILWAGPAVFLLVAVAGFAGLWRRRGASAEALSAEDRARLETYLGGEGQ